MRFGDDTDYENVVDDDDNQVDYNDDDNYFKNIG